MSEISTAGKIVNISGYKFVPLSDLESIREDLLNHSRRFDLKGTILLSTEGINCFFAGSRSAVDHFLEHLRQYPEFADFEAKESFNDYQPFSRMLVKIKPEIITFDMPEVQPARRRARKISAPELKSWLDEGRDLLLLDTRNEYEVELGTFDQARSVQIDSFREFPEAIRSLPEEYKSRPVVMFCTGGIRCEKAGPFMEDAGFEEVWQLDGGILKYFELCGGAHWHGECFVFDKRVALDPELSETATTLCYVCQALLSAEDQRQSTYQFGVSCPYCFQEQPTTQPIVTTPQQRHEQILAATDPLPGSIPYDNYRPMSVSGEMDGLPLLDFLNALRTHLSTEDWLACIAAGRILHQGKPVGLDRKVTRGQKYYHLLPGTVEPDVSRNIQILHEDADLVVIHKPAPIPMHPCGRFHKNTLQEILHSVYQPDRLRLVHRLDANTSGVVVYARTKPLATRLIEQFGQGRVEKEYIAEVHGIPPRSFHSDRGIAAKPGTRGIRFPDDNGQLAHTDFETIATDEQEQVALVRARPRTGRTNQIRIHLWISGYPIVGDPTYLPGGETGVNQTLALSDPPLRLHARRIRFVHPETGRPLEFIAPDPDWADPWQRG